MMMQPCRNKACKRLAPWGEPYCSNHKRSSSTSQGYDYSWSILSKQLIAEHPWCSQCGKRTDLTVDHIDGKTINRERTNLRVLCRSCNTAHRNRYNRELKPR